jgi:DNA-binding CsgD family transcriptional regulator
MDNRLPADQQLSAALHFLHLVLVGKGTAIEELHANNQELGAILDGLLSVRSDLRPALETDGFHTQPLSHKPSADGKDLNLADLARQAELLFQKSEAAVHESLALRAKARNVRTALTIARDGHNASDGPQPSEFNQLSRRERQVLALIVAGKSSKQIAAELGISFKTAVTHRASIMGKMEVHEIASVVREAIRRGWA